MYIVGEKLLEIKSYLRDISNIISFFLRKKCGDNVRGKWMATIYFAGSALGALAYLHWDQKLNIMWSYFKYILIYNHRK
jgi:hypothetical protein